MSRLIAIFFIAFSVYILIFVTFFHSQKKKRNFLLTLVALVLLIGSTLCLLFTRSENLIWVNNAYSDSQQFSLNIKHTRVFATGASYKFQTTETMDDLLSTIKAQYSIASVQDNKIKIYKDNHYYFVKLVESNSKNNIYELEADFIIISDSKNNKFYHIPFPIHVVDNEQIEGTEFPVHCDFDYLKNYYKDFTNVNIEDNKITIEGRSKFTLIYNEGHVVLEI